MVQMFVDSDSRPATGEPGIRHRIRIQLLRGEVGLFKWDGTTNYSTRWGLPATSLVYSWTGGVVTIQISAAELGNTKAFGFVLAAFGRARLRRRHR